MLDLELFLYNEADLKIHYAYKKKKPLRMGYLTCKRLSR